MSKSWCCLKITEKNESNSRYSRGRGESDLHLLTRVRGRDVKRVCYIITITLVVLSFQNCDSFHSLSEKDAEEFSSRAILEVNQELQSQSLAILNSRCASCHDRSSSGGVTHILDVYHLISSALIVPGDSSRGRLLGSIRDSSMPPGSVLASQDL